KLKMCFVLLLSKFFDRKIIYPNEFHILFDELLGGAEFEIGKVRTKWAIRVGPKCRVSGFEKNSLWAGTNMLTDKISIDNQVIFRHLDNRCFAEQHIKIKRLDL